MDILKLFLCAMLAVPATWRISNIILFEDGPYQVFRSLRKKYSAGEFSRDNPDASRMNDTELKMHMVIAKEHPLFTSLLSCFWCLSVWVSILTSFLLALLLGVESALGLVSAIFVVGLSGSAGAIWIEEYLQSR